MGGPPDERAIARPHILFVPADATGHYYQLEKLLKLCGSHEGVTITCVTTERRCTELADWKASGDFHGVDLHLEALFTAPIMYPKDPNFPMRVGTTYDKFKQEFEPFAEKLVDLKAKGLPGVPTCVISDFLLCFAEVLYIFSSPQK